MGKAVWRIAANDRAGVAWASGKRPDRTPNRIRHLHFDFWSGSTASPVNDAAMTTNDAEELCDRFMTAKRPTGGLRSFCEEQPCDDLVVTAFNALRDRLTNPTLPARTLRITPRIVVRESCGAFL